MKLALVIYGSLDTLSGGYLYDRKLVDHLKSCGDEVEIISLPWRNYPLHLSDGFSRRLVERFMRLDVDVLLQDELNHPSLAWVNRHVLRSRSFPIVSIVHHLRSSERHPAVILPLYRQIERSYLRSVDSCIFNSQTTRAEVERLCGSPVDGLVAYPAGDRFHVDLSDGAVRLRASRVGPLRILFAGNLIPRKGLHTLIRALSRLPKSGWLLHVAGRIDVDPRYTSKIRAMIADHHLDRNVFLLGRLSEGRLREEWNRCHVFAVPSQYEGFGIVYLESMAFGVPSVATTAGAASEIIRDGKDGFLVPPEDPPALADRLGMLMDDRALLESISLSALHRFPSFPTWEQTAGQIREYLLARI